MLSVFLLWFSLSFGVQHYQDLLPSYEFIHPPIYAEIDLHADNGVWHFYATYRNEMEINSLTSYKPMNDYFTVGVEVKLDKHVTLSYEHMCQHPVGNWENPLAGEYGGYDTLFISVSTKQ